MPTFETPVEIDFQVYCAKCGAGLCRYTTVSGDDVDVEPCPECMKEKDDDIEELEQKVISLEEEIEELNKIIDSYEKDL